MANFYVKQADTYLPITVNMDLTGATVQVNVKGTTGSVVNLTGTIVSAAAGTLTASTSTLAVDTYTLEVKVTQGGTVTRFPDTGYYTLFVAANLA